MAAGPAGAPAPAPAAAPAARRDRSPSAAARGASAGVSCPAEVLEEVEDGRTLRRWRRGDLLGKGGFSAVWAVHDDATGQRFAAKVVAKASLLAAASARDNLASEIAIHSQLCHPRLVRFERTFEDEHNVYLLLELCGSGGTLAAATAARGALPEQESAAHVAALLSALRYLHASRVAHRDVKPANCLLRTQAPDRPLPPGAPSSLVLCDLGLASRLTPGATRRRGVCGTPNYLSPETLAGTSGGGFEADVWAAGALTHTLLTGAPPFAAPTVPETYARIRAADLRLPESLSPRARGFISAALTPEPQQRATLSALAAHAFLEAAAPQRRAALAPLTPAAAAARGGKGGGGVPSPPPPMAELRARIAALPLLGSPATPREAAPRGARGAHLTPCTPEAEDSSPAAAASAGWRDTLRVLRWRDYPDRYGLGYVLSDGTAGALFLDGTRMATRRDGSLDYTPRSGRRGATRGGGDAPPTPASPASSAPHAVTRLVPGEEAEWSAEATKKVSILRYMAASLGGAAPAAGPAAAPAAGAAAAAPHVRAWARSRHAVVFRLSTRGAHLIFSADGAEMVLFPDCRSVWYYAGGAGAPSAACFDLDALPPSDAAAAPPLRRVHYARALLARLAAGGPADSPRGADDSLAEPL